MLYRWQQPRELIEKMAATVSTRHQVKHRPRGSARVLPPHAEEQLVEWINGRRVDGVPVSSTMLRLQALEASRECGLLDGTGSHRIGGLH
ncbi:TPA: hypothetical protein N0F65_006411 [Lagenidium giganteum]|uniref:HTH CENPB-type domain-containing protein n=1 Tax=Lagenidium giganteum TaxID=4803 RepID=A0AAV2Z4Z6_9STRA|nr:TPA: hypothetical protein N0F65_006411 [Lagenidium giganteum]